MQSERPRLKTAARAGNTTPSSLTLPVSEVSVLPSLSVTDSAHVKASVIDTSWSSRVSALVEKELKLAERMMMELERREQGLEKRDQELERNGQELGRRKH